MGSQKGKRKDQQGSGKKRRENKRWRMFAAIGGLVGTALIVVVSLLGLIASDSTTRPAPSPEPTHAKNKLDVGELVGSWTRPDGGYVINVSSIEPGGQLEASYYNPRPIHVSETKASTTGNTIGLFIKLEDAGYPGSTYTLTYDPRNDVLAGIYFQAALQQSYEVVFVRLK